MSAPGLSLFQGAESLHINTSIPAEDEADLLADQQRRNEELGNLLENAFDDLEADDDTIDSSQPFPSEIDKNTQNYERSDFTESNSAGHQPMRDHVYGKNDPMYLSLPPPPGTPLSPPYMRENEKRTQEFEQEIHRLKMMLESKTHEVENIKKMANEEFAKRDEAQKRVAILEAELDRTLANKSNTHELLVEAKEKCSNLESTIAKIRSEKKLLESENSNLVGQLETSQTLLADLQQKYNMVERDLGKQNERYTEQKVRQLEERHRAEMAMKEQQIEQLCDKLDKKLTELENMSARYYALQSTHEKMLAEKSKTIGELNSAVDRAHEKFQEIMNKPDHFQENVRLQKLVASLQEQITAMEKQICTLTERLESTTAELDFVDSLLHQNDLDDTPIRIRSDRVIGSTPLTASERVGHPRDELLRAIANLKQKREEIRKLLRSVEEKNDEIRRLQDEENKALVQISTLKEEKFRLEHRLKIVENELTELRSKSVEQILNTSKIDRMHSEMEQLKEKNAFLEKQLHELERERNRFELEHNKLDASLKCLQQTHEELKHELDAYKIDYEKLAQENEDLRGRSLSEDTKLELEKHKFLLKDAQMECDRLKELYVEICNGKTMLSYELEKLRSMDSIKELQQERERVANLQRALTLAEVKADELSKLLESEKLQHERDVNSIREKLEKQMASNLKSSNEKYITCSKCMDYAADITKLEIQMLKLDNQNAGYQQKIDDLNKDLKASKDLIVELTEKLKLCEHQEELIKELRVKAQQFEAYIRRSSSEASPPKKQNTSGSSSDKGVGTSPELDKMDVRKIEERIRGEMGKITATYLKRYQASVSETELKLKNIQQEHQQLKVEYKKREAEIDVLKNLILTEREEMGRMLKQKDAENAALIEKQNDLLQKCHEDLKEKGARLSELSKELTERQAQIEAERKSMKAVMAQWEQQSKKTNSIEAEWKEKLELYKKSHESSIESLKSKYNSAKRTAANYKRYAEDKEAHMLKEYERLKYEYDASLLQIERRLKDELEKKRTLRSTMTIAMSSTKEVSSDKENVADNILK